MKIGLGTVQFGLDYGVSNIHGKTTKHEVSTILQLAYENGISLIDTATSYGNSENMLGEVITNDDWKFVTKTPYFVDGCLDNTHVEQLKESFNQSLIRLGQKKIYGLLLHSCDDLLKSGGSLLFREMERLKSIGMIEKIGVSVYDKKQIKAILGKFNIDLIQLPINILDQNLFIDGWLEKLKNKDIEIHARSVFLQGLLLMKKKSISPYFLPIERNLNEFYNLAKKLSLSQLELALEFVMQIDEIDRVIIGINTADQLKDILQAKRTHISSMDLRNISIDDQNYTNPSLWKI